MLGLMQDWPLLLHRIIDHAHANYGERPVVTRSIEGPIETTTYAAIHGRALRLAKRLERDGIKLGDRVATLAWNSARHLEAWYGIVGIGAIYHTVNPRLFARETRRQAARGRALRCVDRQRPHAHHFAEERRAVRGLAERG